MLCLDHNLLQPQRDPLILRCWFAGRVDDEAVLSRAMLRVQLGKAVVGEPMETIKDIHAMSWGGWGKGKTVRELALHETNGGGSGDAVQIEIHSTADFRRAVREIEILERKMVEEINSSESTTTRTGGPRFGTRAVVERSFKDVDSTASPIEG
jgi:hypothetical protein